jgi:hypothetical protein
MSKIQNKRQLSKDTAGVVFSIRRKILKVAGLIATLEKLELIEQHRGYSHAINTALDFIEKTLNLNDYLVEFDDVDAAVAWLHSRGYRTEKFSQSGKVEASKEAQQLERDIELNLNMREPNTELRQMLREEFEKAATPDSDE